MKVKLLPQRNARARNRLVMTRSSNLHTSEKASTIDVTRGTRMLSAAPRLAKVDHHRGAAARAEIGADRLGACPSHRTDRSSHVPDLRYGMNPHQSPATYQRRCTPTGRRSGWSTASRRTSICSTRLTPGNSFARRHLSTGRARRRRSSTCHRPAPRSTARSTPRSATPTGSATCPSRERLPACPGRRSEVVLRRLRRRLRTGRRGSRGSAEAGWSPTASSRPDYEPGTVARLAAKKRGRFLVLRADPTFEAPTVETREVYGLRLTQPRDPLRLPAGLTDGRDASARSRAVHPVQLGRVRPGRRRPSASVPGSSRGSTAPGSPAPRPTRGGGAASRPCSRSTRRRRPTESAAQTAPVAAGDGRPVRR